MANQQMGFFLMEVSRWAVVVVVSMFLGLM
jgi:hypothetical protein